MIERKKQMGRDRVSRLVNWGHWFAFVNGIFAMIIGTRYIETVGYPDSIVSWSYWVISTIGQFSFLAFIVYLVVLFPVTLLLPYSKILRGLSAIVASLSLCLLLYDTIVFDDYGVHLSPFAFDLAWADLNALLHGTSYIVTPIAIVVVELTLANFLWKRIEKIQKKNWGNKVVIFIGICFVSSHLSHIWADAAEITDITRYDDAYPLSYPATARSFMESYGIEGEHKSASELQEISSLNYPIKPMQCTPDRKPDVLVIGVSGLRADLVTPKTMPFLFDYAQDNQQFAQHFSGGNETRSGLFSLLYGLQGSYINEVEKSRLSPVLGQAFAEQGYELGLFASRDLSSSIDKELFFDGFEQHIADNNEGNAVADRQSVESFKRWQAYRSQPWLAFVNLTSPEAYDTPIGFLGIETVKPATPLKAAEKVLFNQYRQSLYFIDKQIEQIVSQVPPDTMIVITGISGKVFTSNSDEARRNLSPENVKVPLIIHWPFEKSGLVQYRTSHHGIAPTLLTQVLACTNPSTDYSAGRSLTKPDEQAWFYVGNKRIFAIYQNDEITVIDRHGKYRIYDSQYQNRLNKKVSAPELIQVLREGRRLYD